MRRLLALGTVGTFLSITCMVATLLVSISGWLLFGSEEKSRPIKIAPVAPLTTAEAVSQHIVESPPGLIAAALEQPAATTTLPRPSPTMTPNPTATLSPTATPYPIVTQPGVATRLLVPKLNLDRPVLFAPIENETWQVNHLEQAVGQLEGTGQPGEHNNLVLAGHVSLNTGAPGPFADLEKLAPGDLIVVYEGDQEFYYIVETSQTVDRTTVEVAYPSDKGQITLITCTNWNSEEGRYQNRLVVKGRLIEI